jgi:hypothetical protein
MSSVWFAMTRMNRAGPFGPSSATLIERVSLWMAIPTKDLTICMPQIHFATGEPKPERVHTQQESSFYDVTPSKYNSHESGLLSAVVHETAVGCF